MIKNHLSKLLGMHRMSQAELARRTGIRPSTINEMYHEISERWTVEHLDRICEVLNCTAADLIEYIPNTSKSTGKALIKEQHGNSKNNV